MSKEVRELTIYRCDICQRTSELSNDKCSICGKEGCYSCLNGVYDCYAFKICKKCRENEIINKFVMDTRDKWNKDRVKLLAKFKITRLYQPPQQGRKDKEIKNGK